MRPDGYGRWAETGRLVGFYLVYDTGTETLATVARKLNGYVGYYRTPRRDLRGMLLFSLATSRRETGVRAALARALASLDGTLDMATTARDYGHPDGPSGPIWALVTQQPDAMRRLRLPDLSQPADVAPVTTPITHATGEPGDDSAAALPLPDWLDDEPSEQIVLLDADDDLDDVSWPA